MIFKNLIKSFPTKLRKVWKAVNFHFPVLDKHGIQKLCMEIIGVYIACKFDLLAHPLFPPSIFKYLLNIPFNPSINLFIDPLIIPSSIIPSFLPLSIFLSKQFSVSPLRPTVLDLSGITHCEPLYLYKILAKITTENPQNLSLKKYWTLIAKTHINLVGMIINIEMLSPCAPNKFGLRFCSWQGSSYKQPNVSRSMSMWRKFQTSGKSAHFL